MDYVGSASTDSATLTSVSNATTYALKGFLRFTSTHVLTALNVHFRVKASALQGYGIECKWRVIVAVLKEVIP